MKVRILLFNCFLVLAISGLVSCGGPNKGHPDTFTIKGNLKNTKGELIRLQVLAVDSISTIDSMIIDEKGSFTIEASISEPGFYLLGTSPDNFISLLIDRGEDLVVEGDIMQLANDYKVSGSQGSQLLWELNNHTRKNYRASDSLLNLLNTSHTNPRFDSIKLEIDSAYNALFDNQRAFVQSFIRKHPNSLASLMALYQIFGRVRVVNEREDIALYQMLDSALYLTYPKNAYVDELHQRVLKLKNEKAEQLARESSLDSGKAAPAFFLKNPAGGSVTLSSFKGNTLLLYFWAGWSEPSKAPIPTYKYLYKKYASKGFTILGVSLDKDRQKWEDAYRENKLNWPQATDLLEWESPLVKDYNVTSLPVAWLIDQNGCILLKRPDDQTLANYLARKYKM